MNRGYVVPAASDHIVTNAARAGRKPLAKQRVKSVKAGFTVNNATSCRTPAFQRSVTSLRPLNLSFGFPMIDELALN